MAVTRPLKEGSVTTYQQKVALGFPDILASEMDADLDTIYAAWNGNVGTANLVDGSVTYAKLAPDAQMWRDTGTTLTLGTSFATRPVLVQSGTLAVQNTAGVAKTRVLTHSNLNSYFSNNYDVTVPAQDDTARPSWMLNLGTTGADVARVRRAAAGSTTLVDLLTLDATGQLTLPTTGVAAASNPLIFGSRTIKGRLVALSSQDWAGLTVNDSWIGSWSQDDAAQPSWHLVAYGTGDSFLVERRPAANGAAVSVFFISNAGSLTISGAVGQKSAGTTWANPSDPRLKNDVAPYARGLADVLALEPITYRLKADPDGPTCYGFDAAQVRDVFPECVSEVRMKLDPADDEETDGVLSFDMHPILVALINAVKELAADR